MSEQDVTFNGTATFYMKSGNTINIICDSVNIETRDGAIVEYTMEGMCTLNHVLAISPSQIEAVIWNPIPVKMTVTEDVKMPVNAIVGSTPATPVLTMRARGARPWSAQARSLRSN